jgi:uncharacterized membrane protein
MYVVASYEGEADEMWLFLPGNTARLSREPSGSGAKYTDGEVVFWGKGSEALLDFGDGTNIKCAENRRGSILETVKLNGGDFWGTGNEPGWTLEMYPGRFVLITNYGDDRYDLALSDPEENVESRQTVFRALGTDVDLTITLTGTHCLDTMSDHEYETTVTVQVGETVYRGCGHALH